MVNGSIHQVEHKTLQRVSAALVFRVISIPLSLAFSITLARLYTPEIVGVYQLSLTFTVVAAAIMSLGLDGAVLQVISSGIPKENQRGAITFALAIPFLVALFVSTLLWFIRNSITYFDRIDDVLWLTLGIIPIITIQRSLIEIYRAYGETHWVAGINGVFGTIIKIVIAFGFIWYVSQSPLGPVAAYTLSSILSVLIILFLLPRTIDLHNWKRVDFGNVKKMLRVAPSLMFNATAWLLLSWLDIFMLGTFSTKYETGIYSVSRRLAILVALPLLAVTAAVPAAAIRHYHLGDFDRYEQLIRDSTRWLFGISMLIVAPLVFYGNLILLFFGKSYQEGATVLTILALGQFFQSISGPTGQILNMMGSHKNLLIATLFALLISGSLYLVLVPKYGSIGAALGTMSGFVFWNLLTGYHTFRNSGRLWFPNRFWQVVMYSAWVMVGMLLSRQIGNHYLGLLIGSISNIIGLFLLLMSKDERMMLNEFISNKLALGNL